MKIKVHACGSLGQGHLLLCLAGSLIHFEDRQPLHMLKRREFLSSIYI